MYKQSKITKNIRYHKLNTNDKWKRPSKDEILELYVYKRTKVTMLKGVLKKDFSWKLKTIKDDLVSLKKIESTDFKKAQVSSKINK